MYGAYITLRAHPSLAALDVPQSTPDQKRGVFLFYSIFPLTQGHGVIFPMPVTREEPDKALEQSLGCGTSILAARPRNQGGQRGSVCCVSCQHKGEITAIGHNRGESGPGDSRQAPSLGTSWLFLAPHSPLLQHQGAAPR